MVDVSGAPSALAVAFMQLSDVTKPPTRTAEIQRVRTDMGTREGVREEVGANNERLRSYPPFWDMAIQRYAQYCSDGTSRSAGGRKVPESLRIDPQQRDSAHDGVLHRAVRFFGVVVGPACRQTGRPRVHGS